MFVRKRWSPAVLLPKAELISYLLMQNPNVSGVAITGSLARFEDKIADIDLVILHNGNMQDGSAHEPRKKLPYYSNDLILSWVLGSGGVSRQITHARGDVPVDFIFVDEKVLWDCEYLGSLEQNEKFKEFYKRVFCDIPLILLLPFDRRGRLIKHLEQKSTINLNSCGLQESEFFYNGMYIRHECGNSECRPKENWEVCRSRIKRRKWWDRFRPAASS